MRRIYLEPHQKEKNGRLLPTSFEDKEYIISLLKKNPSGYKKEDFFNVLNKLTIIFKQPLPASTKTEVFVGKIFEMDFWGLEQIEFTNKKALLTAVIKD